MAADLGDIVMVVSRRLGPSVGVAKVGLEAGRRVEMANIGGFYNL